MLVNVTVHTIYRHVKEQKVKAYGVPIRIRWSEAQKYAGRIHNIRLPDEEVLTQEEQEERALIKQRQKENRELANRKLNGHAKVEETNGNRLNGNGKTKDYNTDEIIRSIVGHDIQDVKLAKERAQALKLALEVQKRRRDDGELISIDQYRLNVANLGRKVRNIVNSISDGFLAEIDGLSAPQIFQALEKRKDNTCKQLAELDWEEENETS